MEGEPFLDLCHLTEVEQTVIFSVLQRDAELRNKEEGRIRKLQQTVSDPVRLRSLSGAWFHEERAKRYQKGGADVVQASIRHKRRGKEEDKSTERELQENISVREDDNGQEEKKRDKEDGERLVQILVSSLYLGLNKLNGSKQSIDSEGDMDSGCTELVYTRFGSVSSLTSHHMMNGSLMSLYSVGDFGDVVVSGQIQFSMQYDIKKEELHVHIKRCQDLASARKNRSDPYVKVYLLPDNTSRSKKKTAVKRKTLNPVYDETVKYRVRRLDLQARVLSMSVWHMERMRRNLFLGEVEVRLAQWDWSQTQPTWHNLQPRVKLSPDDIISRGTILFSIKFVPPGSEGSGCPPTGELHIWLREIVGLLPTKRGAPSTYVKSVVLPDESGISGQQTRMVRGSVNPVFNHTMVYDGFQSSDLIQACAEITVWNPHPSSCLGGVRLSTGSGVSYGQAVCWMDSTEDEISVWSSVIQSPSNWVDTSLPIRTNLQLCSD
uniref:Synaptotagmin-like protein 1 n=1 Tax=Cyprinus carpio carpio TaxID=630221 RepID=A0A8C1FZ30_CYPCA